MPQQKMPQQSSAKLGYADGYAGYNLTEHNCKLPGYKKGWEDGNNRLKTEKQQAKNLGIPYKRKNQ